MYLRFFLIFGKIDGYKNGLLIIKNGFSRQLEMRILLVS